MPVTTIFSTPLRPQSHSTKAIESDDHPSPSPSNQDSMKSAVGHELEGNTWQFDANRLAKVFLPKSRKTPFTPTQVVDSLDAYNDNTIPKEVLRKAVKSFGETPTFPNSGQEYDHYQPLSKLLNNCVKACDEALGDSSGEYYRGLKFVVWDNPTKDGCCGEHHLKPDLAGGIGLPEKEKINENGGLYWRRPGSIEHELLFPVEVKKGWKELVRQAGTYARCLFMASPLRKFALVLGYEYELREIRILVFHHGGLTSSQALNINTPNGIEGLHVIFLAILSWKTVVDAGLPLWCNDSSMFLPGDKDHVRVQVKKILHNAHALRGRCSRVVLVYKVDESNKRNETKSNLTIPGQAGPVSMCALRRSPRIQSQVVASNTKPKSKTPVASNLRPPETKRSTALKPRPKEQGVKDKPTSLSVNGDNEKALEHLPITIPQDNNRAVKEVTQNIIGDSSKLNFASPGIVVKWSWVLPATGSVESDLLRDCSRLFGTPNHYYSFLAFHGHDSPATNHLFLPEDTEIESCYWDLFHPKASSPERRGLWVYVSSFAGQSLSTAHSSKALIHAVLHACLGWFNLIQKGYLHRDISIGNVVMVEDAVQTYPFEILKNESWNKSVEDITVTLKDLEIGSSTKAALEDKLTAALRCLGIRDKCQGFVIDGDMAIKMAGYFNKKHPGSRSGTLPFMSDDILVAAQYSLDYLQSPVDDLFSFYYTMQWAVVFHDQEFAGKNVPSELEILRGDLLGDRHHRLTTTSEITSSSSLRPREYGSNVAKCQPLLRAWYLELQALRGHWKDCQFELEGKEIDAEIFIHLFSTFALRGVASLASLVYTHTKDMD